MGRPVVARAHRSGRQDQRTPRGRVRQGAAGAGHLAFARRHARAARLRTHARLPAHAQARGRRRRTGHHARARRRRAARLLPEPQRRAGRRPRRVLRGAFHRPWQACGDPMRPRFARQLHRVLDARLFGAAPQPEAHRGGAGPVPGRRRGRAAACLFAPAVRRSGLCGPGHLRVHGDRCGQGVLPGGEPAPAGRAYGERGGERTRFGSRTIADCRRRQGLTGTDRARPQFRTAHHQRGPEDEPDPQLRHARTRAVASGTRRAGGFRRSRRRHDLAEVRLDDGQAHRDRT